VAESAPAIPSIDEAERLLFHEARLLDEVRYEEWLQLFTEDGLYWIPIGDNSASRPADPAHDLHIIFDDAARRGERVWRTLNTPVLDQNPRSRTVHSVTNVEVDPEPVDGGDARVWCVQLVSELRPGGLHQIGLNEQRQFMARCEYRLRYLDGDWRISLKKVMLLNRDQPIFNLAFVF
jgi:3-phenylpropionate/cinnamic acid dioxygenase small subunit